MEASRKISNTEPPSSRENLFIPLYVTSNFKKVPHYVCQTERDIT